MAKVMMMMRRRQGRKEERARVDGVGQNGLASGFPLPPVWRRGSLIFSPACVSLRVDVGVRLTDWPAKPRRWPRPRKRLRARSRPCKMAQLIAQDQQRGVKMLKDDVLSQRARW